MKNLFHSLKKTAKASATWLSFIKGIRPGKAFQKYEAPAPPDYHNLAHWAAHPDKKSKADLIPEGSPPPIGNEAQADVFFIHPTSFFANHAWNAPLDHEMANEMIDELVMPGQASVFNQSCRIFAPRYRQATFYVFIEGASNARKALDFAYQDVDAAFTHYLSHYNQGRPFFIASHSQGTLQAIRLLETRIDNSPLREQMVAAYPIGFQFPMDKFEKHFQNLRPSESPLDTGTVIAWDTFHEAGGPIHLLDRTMHWYKGKNGQGTWKKRANKTPLGVNPLSWTRDTDWVESSQNLGAIRAVQEKGAYDINGLYGDTSIGLNAVKLSAPYEAEVSAKLENGFLYISRPKQSFFNAFLLPGLNYHNYDYSLFYMNLRKNIADRLDAFLNGET